MTVKERKKSKNKPAKDSKGKKVKERKGKEGKECKRMQWKGMQWNGMERREMQMHSMHAPQDPHYSPTRARLMRPVAAALARERGDEFSDPPIPTLWHAKGRQMCAPIEESP